MTGIKQSDFNAVTSIDDADNVPLFTAYENKRITYANMRDQLTDEIAVRFIYPTTAQLQQSNLEADEDEPNYVRCEETEYRLYKITALAAGVDDIALDNGRTATYQEEYSKSGFVLGAASSTNNAIALFDGVTGTQLKTGAVLSTIGGNIASAASVSQVSYPRADASNNVAMVTPTTLKTDLNLPSNTASSISAIEGDIAAIEGDIVDINSDLAIKIQTVETFAALATTPAPTAGMVVYLKQHTSGGLGGGHWQDSPGTITNDGGTLINNTVTAGRHWKRIDYGYVTPQMFGALADGISNDCDPFRYAIAASKNIFLPEGTYRISPTGSSGDFMLYLGTLNGNADRSGMRIFGTGRKSVIKLGDNVGSSKLLFGLASSDVISGCSFENFAIDLNGQNNLQVNFGDPLRYNSAFYMFGKCTDFLFSKLYISNISGHQAIRIGADDVNKYGSNIAIDECEFSHFGIGLVGNNQQDVSVVYMQADKIRVTNCVYKNNDFAFDLSRGQTCMELHCDNATIVSGNQFYCAQLPILIVSSYKNVSNVIVEKNIFTECNYIVALDPAELNQKNIKIHNNIFSSTKSKSVIFSIGNAGETSKARENIVFSDNIISGWGNTNQDTHIILIEDVCIRSLEVSGNTVSGFNGSLVYMAGTVRDNDYATINISNNVLDSLGSTSGAFPNDPSFVHVAISSGGINTLTIENNTFFNSAAKDYSFNGLCKIAGRVLNTIVRGVSGNISTNYPVAVDSITGAVTKNIESSTFRPVAYRAGPVNVGGSSSVNLYSFAGFGNNDSAILEIKLFIGTGGTSLNTIQLINVGYSTSGGNVTVDSNFGTYSGDISINYSGSTLRITNNNASSLSLYLNVEGLSTKHISWLV